MRKRIGLLFASLLLIAALPACGTQTPPQTATEPPVSQTETTEDRAAEGDIAPPAGDTRETAAASETSAPQQEAPAQTSAAAAQRETAEAPDQYGPLFRKFVRDPVSDGAYTISMRQSGIAMVTAVSGKDSALESDMAGVLRIRLINRDGKYYMLMESTKKYAEVTAEDYAKQADSLQSATMDLSGVHYRSSGTETVAGKTYQTELYEEDGRGSVTYFFTDAGLARARVVKNGVTNEIESFTVRDEADASMFDVPSDYVKVSDPSQLWT